MNSIFLTLLMSLPLGWQEMRVPLPASLRGVVAGADGFVCAVGNVAGDPRDSAAPGTNPTTKGIVYCSQDGGKTWIDRTPRQQAAGDYRCVCMPDDHTLIIASAGTPAVILRSDNQGEDWQLVYENAGPSAFIDSVRFLDKKRGLALGDPIDGRFLMLATDDGGKHWEPIPCPIEPLEGEAGFAASNGLISFPQANTIVIGLGAATGAETSRALRSVDGGKSWKTHAVEPIPVGPSSGIFGICIREDGKGIAVGGDYTKIERIAGNVALTDDGGITWRLPKVGRPHGFRSSVIYVQPPTGQPAGDGSRAETANGYWLAVGPNGTDISSDGEAWESLSKTGFHALAPPTIAGGAQPKPVAVGSDGRVGVLGDLP